MSQGPVMNKPQTNEAFLATASSDGEKKRVEARVGMANVATDNEETLRMHGRALTVGGEAQLSKDYTGAGLEATIVDVGFDVGNVGGVKMGLSADTGAGVGKNGLTAKVLGTGVKADRSGLEFTILGSGVKLGSWASPWSRFKK